jgi:hypothetical protein
MSVSRVELSCVRGVQLAYDQTITPRFAGASSKAGSIQSTWAYSQTSICEDAGAAGERHETPVR